MTDPLPQGNHDELDWSHLPQRPDRFFGLSKNWTEADVKTVYGKLIRRFRPDRAPDEFQKIRRAYEILMSRLEHDTHPLQETWPAASDGRESEDDFEAQEQQRFAQGQNRWQIVPPPLELALGIDPHDPDESFRKLFHKPVKSADDFLDLAILSDLARCEELSAQQKGSFAHWLWKGLSTYPNSVELTNVLAAYYADPRTKDLDYESGLQRVEKLRPAIVSGDLISALIFGVARSKGMRRALALWDQQFQPVAGSHRELIAVLKHLLPTAAWEGEHDWVMDQLKFLEQDLSWQHINFEGLERTLQIVSAVRQIRPDLLKSSPLTLKTLEICGRILLVAPAGRRDLLLKAVDEIQKRQSTVLSGPLAPQTDGLWISALWEYLLIDSDIIRPFHKVDSVQILALRQYLVDIATDMPLWIWRAGQWTGGGLLLSLFFVAIVMWIILVTSLVPNSRSVTDALLVIVGLISTLTAAIVLLYRFKPQILRSSHQLFWPLLARAYHPQRRKLLMFWNAQPMPVHALQILLRVADPASSLANVNKALRQAILVDSELVLLAVTSRAT